jgi:predicted nucleic acid-binding Zn ribbon protein
MEHVDDWQRTTDHPSARALLSFLEADLSRGLRLLRQLRAEEDAKRKAEVLAEIRQVEAEVERWVRHAGWRGIPVTGFETHLAAFRAALEEGFGAGGRRS